MTDPHMRILRRVARQRRVELEAHDAAHDTAGTEGRHQRLHLQQSATRATERVAEAQARRRGPTGARPPAQTRQPVIQHTGIECRRPKRRQ